MPTVDQWIRSLTTDYQVTVVSSDNLMQEVRQKQDARINNFMAKQKPPPDMKRQLVPLAAFEPELVITVSPAALLHALGRATTPPIPNLVDLSSTWALVRYVWAFDPLVQPQRLTLSSAARMIDPHQKSVLSDDLGVAMATYLMATYLGTPELIDVSQAVATPTTWNADLRLSTSPDYLYFDHPTGNVYVVECKGNQTSRNSSLDQLRRGTEQVPSLVLGNAQTAGSLIIATCMADCAEVYVVDPPAERNSNFEEYVETGGKTRRIGPRSWVVEDREKFVREAEGISRAKILSFAGAVSEASTQIERTVPEWQTPFVQEQPPLSRLETNYGDFEGLRTDLPFSGARVGVFRGIRTGVRNWLSSPEASLLGGGKVRSVTQMDREERGVDQMGFRAEVEERVDGIAVRSYGEDGTVFSLDVSG